RASQPPSLPRRRGGPADDARVRSARLPRRPSRPRLLARPADGVGLGRALLHRDGLGRRLPVATVKRAIPIALAAFLAGAAAVAVPSRMGVVQALLVLLAVGAAALAAALAVRLSMEQRAAREVEEARRALVAAASHDLRTPLASLRLLVDAIEDGVATGE